MSQKIRKQQNSEVKNSPPKNTANHSSSVFGVSHPCRSMPHHMDLQYIFESFMWNLLSFRL